MSFSCVGRVLALSEPEQIVIKFDNVSYNLWGTSVIVQCIFDKNNILPKKSLSIFLIFLNLL